MHQLSNAGLPDLTVSICVGDKLLLAYFQQERIRIIVGM